MSQESTGKGPAGSAQTSPSNKSSQGAQSPRQSPSTAQSQRDHSNQAQSQSRDKSNQAQSQPSTQRNQSSQAQGQGSMQQGGAQRNESTQAGRAGASGSTSTEAGGSAANVTLNNEQKTKIRETVINASSAPRVSNLNVSVSVGTVIPSSVRIVPVPSVLVEVNPGWRGYEYFVYNDEIILVDPRTHRIIAILPV
jgi:hypothetical protein